MNLIWDFKYRILKRFFAGRPTRAVLKNYFAEPGMVITEFYSRRDADSIFCVLFADQRDQTTGIVGYRIGAYFRYDRPSGTLAKVERDDIGIKPILDYVLKRRTTMQYFLFRLKGFIT